MHVQEEEEAEEEEEAREVGAVSMQVAWRYGSAAGGTGALLLLGALFALEQAVQVYSTVWIGVWVENKYRKGIGFYLGVYAGLMCVVGAVSFLRAMGCMLTCARASVGLHSQLLAHLVRLPKAFFDTTPAGERAAPPIRHPPGASAAGYFHSVH